MAGHEGIQGNEAADKEAKKAAKGLTANKPSLLLYLCRALLINSSAVKQQHSAALKEEWKNTWHKSNRGRQLLRVDKITPSIASSER
jgi:hypothetical protein